MNINWTIRFKNPVFWVSIIAAIFVPILAYLGMSWNQITSWTQLGDVIFTAIKNPVIFLTVIVSVYNTIIDPTTKGVSDSINALTYTEPK